MTRHAQVRQPVGWVRANQILQCRVEGLDIEPSCARKNHSPSLAAKAEVGVIVFARLIDAAVTCRCQISPGSSRSGTPRLDFVFFDLFTSISIASTGCMSASTRRRMRTLVVFFRVHQQLFFPRAAAVHVDGGVDPPFDQPAVEVEFAVARTLELFEDHFVHLRAGVDQCGGEDGEANRLLTQRAAPKNRFGFCIGVAESRPPERAASRRRAFPCCGRGPGVQQSSPEG